MGTGSLLPHELSSSCPNLSKKTSSRGRVQEAGLCTSPTKHKNLEPNVSFALHTQVTHQINGPYVQGKSS